MMTLRLSVCGRNGRLGFPIWLPLLLGVLLFLAGQLLAGERHHRVIKPAQKQAPQSLIYV